jgi:TRAP transporter TAXI family solute receptor
MKRLLTHRKGFSVVGLILLSMLLILTTGARYASAELPAVINIGTLKAGTLMNAIDLTIAHEMSKYLGKTVKAIPYTKDRPKLISLMEGESQFVSISCGSAYSAMRGTLDYKDPGWRPLQLEIIQHGVMVPITMGVRGDSNIHKLSELKGKKIGHVPGWPQSRNQANAFLAFGGITQDEVTWIPFPSYNKSIDGLMAGQADAVSFSPISPKVHEAFASPVGLRFLPVPKDDVQGWNGFYKYLPMYPHGVWKWGICEDNPLDVGIGSYFHGALPKQSEGDVYTIVKALFETFPKYRGFKPPSSNFFSLEHTLDINYWAVSEIAFHPGLIKYAKEQGFWTKRHEEYQKKAKEAEQKRIAAKK